VNVDGLAVRFIVEVVERGDVQPAMSLPVMAFLAERNWYVSTICVICNIVFLACIAGRCADYPCWRSCAFSARRAIFGAQVLRIV